MLLPSCISSVKSDFAGNNLTAVDCKEMYKGQEEKYELLNWNGKKKKKGTICIYASDFEQQNKAPCAVEISNLDDISYSLFLIQK